MQSEQVKAAFRPELHGHLCQGHKTLSAVYDIIVNTLILTLCYDISSIDQQQRTFWGNLQTSQSFSIPLTHQECYLQWWAVRECKAFSANLKNFWITDWCYLYYFHEYLLNSCKWSVRFLSLLFPCLCCFQMCIFIFKHLTNQISAIICCQG